ncbi:hypothetical protein NEOLEDRAFT_1244217 [Neolentinus lepideus HHB14362 ss-1]|uniref:Uncharacterized protein n=1 Tax=Neolentinus lepideus HHB14362 ss-1 TaxID=1314782 RepID=A0A165Q444_9AGAM|nr:hypothetical protein NEOLEDRAFT_1244217 [Neolentinus lepideus HHB14362 ss-1]
MMMDELDSSPTQCKRRRPLDEDIVIWQGSQSNNDSLNQLIRREASQKHQIPRIPSFPDLNRHSYLPEDLEADPSSPAVRNPQRKKRTRPSRTRSELVEPEQVADPSDWVRAVRKMAEHTSAKAQKRMEQEQASSSGRPPPVRVHSHWTVDGSRRAVELKREQSAPRTCTGGAGTAGGMDADRSLRVNMVVDCYASPSGSRSSLASSSLSVLSPPQPVLSTKAPPASLPPPGSAGKCSQTPRSTLIPPSVVESNTNITPSSSKPSHNPIHASTYRQQSNPPTVRRTSSPCPPPPKATQSSSRPPVLGMRRVHNATSSPYALSPSQELPMKRKGFKSPLLNPSQVVPQLPQTQSKANHRGMARSPENSLPTPDQTPSPNDCDGVSGSPPPDADSSFGDFDTSWDMDQLHESLKQYDSQTI